MIAAGWLDEVAALATKRGALSATAAEATGYRELIEVVRGRMKLEKRTADGAPRPVVVCPLDMATVQDLLEEKGVQGTNIPDDWWLGIEEEALALGRHVLVIELG